jgi:hypothetical protein
MFASAKKLFRRSPKSETEVREDEEARLRGQQEYRAAELRKSDDQRGIEGFSQRYLGPH